MNCNTVFRRTAMVTAIASISITALAADDVAALIKPESSVSVGVGAWSHDRPKLGTYDGMRDDKAYGLLDAEIVRRDDATGTWLLFGARNLGLDTRDLRLEYNRQGDFGGSVEYSRTPRDNPYTFNTSLQGIGTTSLTHGSGVGALSFPKREVELGTVRDLLRLGGYKNLAPGLDLKVDFRNEEKDGTRHWGWGSNPLFAVEPIDSRTRQLEIALQYQGERLQLSGGYYGSWYDNAHGQVLGTVNGATAGTTASPGTVPLSLPLDNHSHQLFFDGGYSFSPTTRGTVKVAYSRAYQNEELPSYSLTGVNAPLAGSPSRLNGRVDTTLVQFALSSRPIPKLSLLANLRYNDVSDKTPIDLRVASATGVYGTPHSFTTTSGKLEGTYQLPANFSAVAGLDMSRQQRSYPLVGSIAVPFRGSLNETTYRVQLRRTLDETLTGTIGYFVADRHGSSYIKTTSTGGTIGNPGGLYNPTHIADRAREKLRGSLDWSPLEKLSVQFVAEGSRDHYDHSNELYGLQKGRAGLYSVDASYALSEEWKLNGWYSYDVNKVDQKVATTPVNDVSLKESTNALGFGVKGKLNPKIDLSADIEGVFSTTRHAQTGTGANLPGIQNRLARLKLNGTYALEKNADLRFDFIHERWRTDDWTWKFANGSPYAYTSTGTTVGTVVVNDGTVVTAPGKQVSNFIGARYIYKFQ